MRGGESQLVVSNSLLSIQDGSALKILATAARLDVEDFVGKEVYLEVLHVS